MVNQNLPSYFVCSWYFHETTHCGICLISNENLHWASRGEVWAKIAFSFGAIFSLIALLLRGGMIFCYHVNKFLTVGLRSEIFTEQNPNLEKIISKNGIFGPNLMPSAGFCLKSGKYHSE